MISLETVQATSRSIDPSSPRISFSADFLHDKNFIPISPSPQAEKDGEAEREKARNAEFEFLSSKMSSQTMLAADELFFEGRLLPFWQMQHSEKLNKISLKTKEAEEGEGQEMSKEEPRVWFVDDDPSPRPPKCTVLWKELLRLKKQRASSLSPSSSSSSTSSTSSSALADIVTKEEGKHGPGNGEKHVKRIRKGLERTRSASIRIRPMINVPICTPVKSSALPPLGLLIMMDTVNYNENDDKAYGLDKIISSSTLFLLRRQLSTFQLLTYRNLRGAMPPAKMQSLRIRDCRVICRGKVIDIRRSLTANHQTSSFYKNIGARCFKLHKLEVNAVFRFCTGYIYRVLLKRVVGPRTGFQTS
ncbi:hypothetical protein NC651_024264 [Populus alba x Populus x berolinensis]|nr:hypothetical protein NC651_024264 [Populus alba x Populus x berolinensis]